MLSQTPSAIREHDVCKGVSISQTYLFIKNEMGYFYKKQCLNIFLHEILNLFVLLCDSSIIFLSYAFFSIQVEAGHCAVKGKLIKF